MLDTKLQEEIDNIYSEYIKELKPLIAFVEHNYRKFPKGVLKEFRDVFDHIARLYLTDQDTVAQKDNISKARNHFSRLKLDIYKYLCDYRKKEINRWLSKYSKYDLTIIDNGSFWYNIQEHFDECEAIFFRGRSIEHSDVTEACSYYEDYINKCEATFKYIDAKKKLINGAVFKQLRTQTQNIIFGFILGIIGSIIASIIYNHIALLNNISSDHNVQPSAIESTIQNK